MLTILVIVVVVLIFIVVVFSSMNKTIEKIGRETDESAGKPLTFFGYIKHFINLIGLFSIIVFYCAILYVGYLVYNLIW